MKPLPDELQFGREMVLSVALEMEEKRRQMPKQTPEEIEEEGEEREEGEDQVRFNSHAAVFSLLRVWLAFYMEKSFLQYSFKQAF